MSGHQSQVPERVYDYFKSVTHTLPGWDEPVLIEQVFTPGKGWRNHPTRKRVSHSWLRKLRGQGVTHVALRYHGRLADFGVTEALKPLRPTAWPDQRDML